MDSCGSKQGLVMDASELANNSYLLKEDSDPQSKFRSLKIFTLLNQPA